MANLGTFGVDPNAVAPSQPNVVRPEGFYNVQLVKDETKPTSKNDGSWLLEMQFRIIDGPYAGGVFFERLNLGNSNPTAVEMARASLSAICHAVGYMQPVNDTGVLYGKPLQLLAKIEPATLNPDGSIQYAEKNVVKGYAKPGANPVVTEVRAVSATPVTPTHAGPPAPSAAAAAGVGWTPPGAVGVSTAAAVAAQNPAAPVAAPAPLPPPAAVAAPPARVMTAKANGATYEQFTANGWTDAALIADGYMQPAAPAAPVAAPAPPAGFVPSPQGYPQPGQPGGPPSWPAPGAAG